MVSQAIAETQATTLDAMEVLKRLQNVISVHDAQAVISLNMTMQQLAWDSLRHVEVMLDVERQFGINFSDSHEWTELATIDELVQAILVKMQQ